MPRKWISRHRTRRIATHMALVVVALQVALLLTFVLTPTPLPPRLTLFELLWAAARRPTFYPFVALLLAGPPLTVLAMGVRGWHRLGLIVAWTVCLVVLIHVFGDRVALMLRILAHQL